MKPKIQVYYGMKGNNGEHEWYITRDYIHYGCIIKKAKRYYRYDKTAIYPNGEPADRTLVFKSVREAAKHYGTITNSLTIQQIVKFWHNFIYMPYWNVYWKINDILHK